MSKFKALPIVAGAAALGTAAFFAPSALANPYQISTCLGNGSCPDLNPTPISPSGFDIVIEGNHTALDPLLILIASPSTGATTPTLSVDNTGDTPASSATYYGLMFATSGTLTAVQEATLSANGSAYDALHLAGGDSSQSYQSYGATGTFDLYAIAVNTGSGWTGTNGPFDLTNVEKGSFVFEYGCSGTSSPPPPNTVQCNTMSDNIGSTPFSNTGQVVPAPVIGHGLVVLLAVGGVLLGSGLMERSKKRRSLGTA